VNGLDFSGVYVAHHVGIMHSVKFGHLVGVPPLISPGCLRRLDLPAQAWIPAFPNVEPHPILRPGQPGQKDFFPHPTNPAPARHDFALQQSPGDPGADFVHVLAQQPGDPVGGQKIGMLRR